MNSEETNVNLSEENISEQNETTTEPVAETENIQTEGQENLTEQAAEEPAEIIAESTETPEVAEEAAPVEETAAEVQEEPVEAPAAQAVEEPAPVEVPASQDVVSESTPENTAEIAADEPKEADASEVPQEAPGKPERKNNWQEQFNKIYDRLKDAKDNNEVIETEVKARIRGGLRVVFEDMPLFLPASHFSLKRTPTEQELLDAVNTKINVHVHELQEFDEGRKAVIVSRKQILLDEFWEKIQVGDILEGRVSSIASFGVFLDLGGVEGLIHISRLSQVHISDPNKLFKKGDLVKAVVVELDRNKNRIALSRKELEESPWKGVETDFAVGTQHNGIVRRLTEFGAYVELKPGVDGLLRTAEISWTKRIKRPADVFKPGEEIPVEIISVSEEKQTVGLSYKKTQPNPWVSMIEKYPIGMEFTGVITQVMPQGIIVSVNDEIDGFMPRSKMRQFMQGNKIPFHPGETIEIKIADLIPDDESLILAPKEEAPANAEQQRPRRNNQPQKEEQKHDKAAAAPQASITLVDLISDTEKKSLFNSMTD